MTASPAFRILASLFRPVFDLLLPPSCSNCDVGLESVDDGVLLCRSCRDSFALDMLTRCEHCGARMSEWGRCASCSKSEPQFETVVPLGTYHGELRNAILKMKRPAFDHLSKALGRLFCRVRIDRLLNFKPDIVVPVPMYWSRWVRRGTNSAEIFANVLGGEVDLPVMDNLLVRCRNTLPQARLSPQKRFANVRGAFRLGMGYDLGGVRAVLVDDILTTGATCNEAAKVLKKAGASAVAVAVLGRTHAER